MIFGRKGLKDKIPRHIAIVMDGNGRWAEARGLPRFEGHCAGVEAVKNIVRACLDKKIPVLSLFAFSSENWGRPQSEVEFLMQLFIRSISNELDELQKNNVSLRFVGCRDDLSDDLQQEMRLSEIKTASNQGLILNVGINYGGRWDIVHAAKKLARQVVEGQLSLDKLDETGLDRLLDTSDLPDPDLFIRTGGEQRISNFFLWQLAYTELYFTEVFWPDFTSIEFEKALASFAERERRFGKIAKQVEKTEYV